MDKLKIMLKHASHIDSHPEGSPDHNQRSQNPTHHPHSSNPQEHAPSHASSASSIPHGLAVYPQPGQSAPGPGHMPPKVASLKYTDSMAFHHPSGDRHNVLCDLGFSGVLDGHIIWSFGDTLMGTEEHHMICATDSIALGDAGEPETGHGGDGKRQGRRHDPMAVTNTSLGPKGKNVFQWIPVNEEEKKTGGMGRWSFGGTNVVQIRPAVGLVYYYKMRRGGGEGQKAIGAGIAKVRMTWEDGRGAVPVAERVGDTIWDSNEAKYGDVGVMYNAQDDMVYAYGHGPNGNKEIVVRTFLCRAPAMEATRRDAYEYWDNEKREWTRSRFTLDGQPGTIQLKQEHAVFGWMAMNQANPFWSNYFNKWMFLFGDCFGYSDIKCWTADKLEGPWKKHGIVATTQPEGHGKGMRYCATGHPEFDQSGKTVLATWTRNNVIWGVVIDWE